MADSFAHELDMPCYFREPRQSSIPITAVLTCTLLCFSADILNGDPVPTEAMDAGHSFDRAAWFKSHTPVETRPPINAILKHLRGELGLEKIGAVGYCYG